MFDIFFLKKKVLINESLRNKEYLINDVKPQVLSFLFFISVCKIEKDIKY